VYRFKYLTQVILLVGIMTCIQGIVHCADVSAPNQSPTVLSPLRFGQLLRISPMCIMLLGLRETRKQRCHCTK
ncbi:unnamed protein product, partial [Musa textilis]